MTPPLVARGFVVWAPDRRGSGRPGVISLTIEDQAPLTSGAKAAGRFGKQDFVYLPDQDVNRCPAGSLLPRHMTVVERGMALHRYWDRAGCSGCNIKARCTPAVERKVTRWEPAETLWRGDGR